MSDKDLFEEFEFKPLTDGLGFNKKAQPVQIQMNSSSSLSNDFLSSPTAVPAQKKSFDDVLATLERSPLNNKASGSLEFVDALPREKVSPAPMAPVQASGAGLTMPTISPFPSIDVYKKIKQTPAAAPAVGVRRGGHDAMAPNLEAVSVSFASAFLDSIVIFAMFLVFLVTLLLITNVELSSVIHHVENNAATKVSMLVLFLSVLQIYVVLSRSLFGQTLGEWTFDLQMGRKEDQVHEMYPLRILGRSLLVLATGLVTLPLLSLIFNQDLAARLAKVQLYRQKI